MKKLTLISSFCDTKEKIDVLKENIIKLKQMGLDVLLITPFWLDKDVIDLCDYCFITKDNPVLDWPNKAIFIWKEFYINGKKLRINKTFADYGFAGLYQVKQLGEIALNLNYDYFYYLIYDIIIDNNVIEGLTSQSSAKIYPSKRGDTIWETGLHFMIFNRENLKRFVSNIYLDNYIVDGSTDAFKWLKNLRYVLPYEISQIPVEDKIYYYDNYDFFNYSPSQHIKFFIEKNDESLDNIKLFFYEIEDNFSVDLQLDNNEFHSDISQCQIVDLGFNKFNIKNVVIYINETRFDITDIIKKVKHNTINFYD
jgi:hypothetical protein